MLNNIALNIFVYKIFYLGRLRTVVNADAFVLKSPDKALLPSLLGASFALQTLGGLSVRTSWCSAVHLLSVEPPN